MSKRLLLVVAIGVAALLAWSPVAAQDSNLSEEELALVDFVSTAFDNLNAQGTYRLESEQETTQSIDMGPDGAFDQTVVALADMQLLVDDESQIKALAGQGTTSTQMDMGPQLGQVDFSLVVDMRVVESDYYMRFSVPGEDALGLGALYGDDWYVMSLDDVAEQFEGVPGFEGVDITNLLQVSGSSIQSYILPVNVDTVSAIRELDSEQIDGQTMRVFLIDIDYAGVVPPELTQAFSEFGADASVGIDYRAFMESLIEGFDVQQKVWIGEDDEIPHRTEVTTFGTMNMSELASMFEDVPDFDGAFAGSDFNIDTNTVSITTFSDFGVPFEVEAPEDAVSFLDLLGF